MSNPKLLDMPLAQNADKNDIPVTDSGSTGLFSQQYGWQLINAIPPQNGGKAVKREDFNGVFNLIGDLLYHIQKGYTFEFDSRQSYWKGCKVRDPATGLTYQALNDIPANSTNPPHEDTSNWVICPAEQGYIIPSTAYAVGATANHYALPPSYYLECTTPGTTGATTPVITPPVFAGDTITDGTVVWTVRQCLPTSGGTLIGKTGVISAAGDENRLFFRGGSSWNNGGFFSLVGENNADEIIANDSLMAFMGVPFASKNGYYMCGIGKDGSLQWGDTSNHKYDLGGSAIVAKSITGTSWYRKQADGLIVQGGKATQTVGIYNIACSFPISFNSTNYSAVAIVDANYGGGGSGVENNPRSIYINTKSMDKVHFYVAPNSSPLTIHWLAVGY